MKVLRLIAASAVLCERRAPNGSDFWVLHMWDREEQIEPLAALINGVLEKHADESAPHPLAAVNHRIDAEELAKQLDAIEQELAQKELTLAGIGRLKERVADVADQAAWLADNNGRTHILERTRKFVDRLG